MCAPPIGGNVCPPIVILPPPPPEVATYVLTAAIERDGVAVSETVVRAVEGGLRALVLPQGVVWSSTRGTGWSDWGEERVCVWTFTTDRDTAVEVAALVAECFDQEQVFLGEVPSPVFVNRHREESTP